MKAKTRAELQAEWDRKLAREGMPPEAPDHEFRPGRRTTQEIGAARDRALHLEQAKAYLERFGKRMPAAHRAVWRLHCEGLSIRDIAKRRRLPRATVGEWVQRTTEAMRLYLARRREGRGEGSPSVRVRLSEVEHALVQEAAKKAGITPAGLLRQLIFATGTKPPRRDDPDTGDDRCSGVQTR